ncbi:hypothetical protein Y032_0023g672 [Ancylostoma ceylanicum]|nr:hypothetical protein Y032_0023g672 [Ancylostoma ceylanicum]
MTTLSARQRTTLMRNKSGDKTPGKGSTMIEAIKVHPKKSFLFIYLFDTPTQLVCQENNHSRRYNTTRRYDFKLVTN